MNIKTLIAAATPIPSPPSISLKSGSLGTFKAPSDAFTFEVGAKAGADAATTFERILSIALGGFTIVAAVYFLFTLAVAAFSWMGAGGDTSKIEKARNSMTNGLIGLVILVAVYSIVGIVGTMLGIDILNPGTLLLELAPTAPTP